MLGDDINSAGKCSFRAIIYCKCILFIKSKAHVGPKGRKFPSAA